MGKRKNKWMTPSEFGFRLDLASYTARRETADLERVKQVQTPPVVPTLRQSLQVARDKIARALGR